MVCSVSALPANPSLVLRTLSAREPSLSMGSSFAFSVLCHTSVSDVWPRLLSSSDGAVGGRVRAALLANPSIEPGPAALVADWAAAALAPSTGWAHTDLDRVVSPALRAELLDRRAELPVAWLCGCRWTPPEVVAELIASAGPGEVPVVADALHWRLSNDDLRFDDLDDLCRSAFVGALERWFDAGADRGPGAGFEGLAAEVCHLARAEASRWFDAVDADASTQDLLGALQQVLCSNAGAECVDVALQVLAVGCDDPEVLDGAWSLLLDTLPSAHLPSRSVVWDIFDAEASAGGTRAAAACRQVAPRAGELGFTAIRPSFTALTPELRTMFVAALAEVDMIVPAAAQALLDVLLLDPQCALGCDVSLLDEVSSRAGVMAPRLNAALCALLESRCGDRFDVAAALLLAGFAGTFDELIEVAASTSDVAAGVVVAAEVSR
jgi:hypothetical protein